MKRPCSLLSVIAAQVLAGCCGPEPLIINGSDPSSSGCEAIGETPLSLSGSTPNPNLLLTLTSFLNLLLTPTLTSYWCARARARWAAASPTSS